MFSRHTSMRDCLTSSFFREPSSDIENVYAEEQRISRSRFDTAQATGEHAKKTSTNNFRNNERVLSDANRFSAPLRSGSHTFIDSTGRFIAPEPAGQYSSPAAASYVRNSHASILSRAEDPSRRQNHSARVRQPSSFLGQSYSPKDAGTERRPKKSLFNVTTASSVIDLSSDNEYEHHGTPQPPKNLYQQLPKINSQSSRPPRLEANLQSYSRLFGTSGSTSNDPSAARGNPIAGFSRTAAPYGPENAGSYGTSGNHASRTPLRSPGEHTQEHNSLSSPSSDCSGREPAKSQLDRDIESILSSFVRKKSVKREPTARTLFPGETARKRPCNAFDMKTSGHDARPSNTRSHFDQSRDNTDRSNIFPPGTTTGNKSSHHSTIPEDLTFMSHGRPNTTEVVREQAKPSEGAKLVVLDEPFVAPETQDRAKKSATRKIAADKIVPASIRPPAVQVQALKNFTLPRQRANLPFEMTEDDGSSCGEFADVVNSQGIHHVQESEDTGNLEDPFALLMANTSQPPMEEMVEQTYPRSRADCSLTQVDNVADEDLSDSLFVEDRAGRAVDEATVVRHTAPCVTDDSKTPFPVTGDRQNLISRGYKRPGIYRGNQGRLPNRLKKVSSLGKKVFPIDICRSTKAAEPEQIQLQECSLPLVRESEANHVLPAVGEIRPPIAKTEALLNPKKKDDLRTDRNRRKPMQESDLLILQLRNSGHKWKDVKRIIEQQTGFIRSAGRLADRYKRLTAISPDLNKSQSAFEPARPCIAPITLSHTYPSLDGDHSSPKAQYVIAENFADNKIFHPPSDVESEDNAAPQHPTVAGKSWNSEAFQAYLASCAADASESEVESDHGYQSAESKSELEDTITAEDALHWAYTVKRKTWDVGRNEEAADWVACGNAPYISLRAANAAAGREVLMERDGCGLGPDIRDWSYSLDENDMARYFGGTRDKRVNIEVQRFLRDPSYGVMPSSTTGWLKRQVYEIRQRTRVFAPLKRADEVRFSSDTVIEPDEVSGEDMTMDKLFTDTASDADFEDALFDALAAPETDRPSSEIFATAETTAKVLEQRSKLSVDQSQEDNDGKEVTELEALDKEFETKEPNEGVAVDGTNEAGDEGEGEGEEEEEGEEGESADEGEVESTVVEVFDEIYTLLDQANREAGRRMLVLMTDRQSQRIDEYLDRLSKEREMRGTLERLEADKQPFQMTARVKEVEYEVWVEQRELTGPRNI